ncbi:hypothetical protein GQR58_016333 [Nymphon striatum]|nr:hypothetical protein GQR58_016333 [Nymphon striatum]
MHRKIPKSRRHKKLKFVDPEYKSKTVVKKDLRIDAKPADIDAQEIPKKCHQLMQISHKIKNNVFSTKPSKQKRKSKLITIHSEKKKKEYGMTKPTKSTPESVVQKPYETDNQFVNRVSHMASVAMQETTMEVKFGVKVGYDDEDKVEEDPRIISLLKKDDDSKSISKKKLPKIAFLASQGRDSGSKAFAMRELAELKSV